MYLGINDFQQLPIKWNSRCSPGIIVTLNIYQHLLWHTSLIKRTPGILCVSWDNIRFPPYNIYSNNNRKYEIRIYLFVHIQFKYDIKFSKNYYVSYAI